jgi:Fur family peroxide stress response transcriptional regulator
MPDAETLQKRMRAFLDGSGRLGLKLTHQRLEIFRVVVSTEEHPDAVAVYRRVKKRIPTISLDTVYRNLKILAEHGLISIVGMSQENHRFDGNPDSHHHFTCVKCGLIRDFTSAAAAGSAIPAEARKLGTPLSLHLEVKGICAKCRKGIVEKQHR